MPGDDVRCRYTGLDGKLTRERLDKVSSFTRARAVHLFFPFSSRTTRVLDRRDIVSRDFLFIHVVCNRRDMQSCGLLGYNRGL